MTDEVQTTLMRSRAVLSESTLRLHESGAAASSGIAELLSAGVPLRRILNLYPYQLHEWQAGYDRTLAVPGTSAILDRRSWNLTRGLVRHLPVTSGVLSQQDYAAYAEIRLRTVLGPIGTSGHLHFLMMAAHVLATSSAATELLQDSHVLGHAQVLLNTLEGVLQAGLPQANAA